MSFPDVVSSAEWDQVHQALLRKEKAATTARDALAAERRRLPVAAVEKEYVFEGPDGAVSLLELFAGRSQLIVYHFIFAPGVDGWPSAGCPGCSMFVDQIAHPSHLHARNTSLVVVSRAPLANIETYRRRMGWTLPWYSSAANDFNRDFGLTTDEGEIGGLSVLIRDGDKVFRSYFGLSRGLEDVGSVWSLLDLTPLGRQEEWEDTPAGRPQTPPYQWWRRHDEYA